MKFWITAIIGVLVLSAVGTLMFIRNPDMQKQPKVEVKPQAVVVPENAPVATVTKTIDKVENVPQMKDGKSFFEIKNTGKSPLKLTLGKKSCKCLTTELDKEEVPPGGVAKFTIVWTVKTQIGKLGASAAVETNDPLRGTLTFAADLNIVQDMLLDPPDLQFGRFREGEALERTSFMFAPNFDRFTISELKPSSKAFTASFRQMTPEELKDTKRQGKSGVAITVKCDGRLPVGEFQEALNFKTNFDRVPNFTMTINGQVEGKISLSPAKLDFGAIVDAETTTPLKQIIFASGLGEKETLKIGQIEPNYVSAVLERNKDFPTNWTMLVRLTKDTPAGDFKCWISLVDSKGEKRISVPVMGVMPGALELAGPTSASATGQ